MDWYRREGQGDEVPEVMYLDGLVDALPELVVEGVEAVLAGELPALGMTYCSLTVGESALEGEAGTGVGEAVVG